MGERAKLHLYLQPQLRLGPSGGRFSAVPGATEVGDCPPRPQGLVLTHHQRHHHGDRPDSAWPRPLLPFAVEKPGLESRPRPRERRGALPVPSQRARLI